MRKHVLMILALGALIAVSAVGIATAAGGETPVTVKVGNLELTANGGFSPKALSKTKQTPIELKASGEVKEADGSHPPAVREVIIEADKNGEVHVKGIPTCNSGQLQATDTTAALKACKSALIGEGEATAQVAFAEQKPINVNSKLLVFNGGEKGGKTTMFIHAYFSQPDLRRDRHHGDDHQAPERPLRHPRRSPKSRRSPAAAGSIISFNLKSKRASRSAARLQPDQREVRRREAESPRPRQIRRRDQGGNGNRPRLHAEGLSFKAKLS